LEGGNRVLQKTGRDSRATDRVLVYRLSMRAFLTYTDNYKLFYIICYAALVLLLCVLCVFGPCILEPVFYSAVLTIVHLDGTPILPLHITCVVRHCHCHIIHLLLQLAIVFVTVVVILLLLLLLPVLLKGIGIEYGGNNSCSYGTPRPV
jgi:hypothetical protein